jgi:hypothetical protein
VSTFVGDARERNESEDKERAEERRDNPKPAPSS